MELKSKKLIAIGDRDGVPGPAIEECLRSAEPSRSLSPLSASFERQQGQWTWRIRRGSRTRRETGRRTW